MSPLYKEGDGTVISPNSNDDNNPGFKCLDLLDLIIIIDEVSDI